MKKLLSFSLLFLWTLPIRADQEWLGFDIYRRVPWANGGGYDRCEFDWWVLNTHEPTELFLNGVSQGFEHGTNDIRLAEAWQIHPQGVTIGIVDVNNAHGQRVKSLAEKVTRNQAFLSNSLRLYPDDIASGISNFSAMRFQVIVVTTGFNFPHAGLSNACRFAEMRGSLIFCAVPNAGVDIDVSPDYPSSWADRMANIVPVTATDRNGNLYGPGAAAWGTNCVGGPGRNIISGGLNVYASGTSSATPIVAGCTAILMQYKRGRSAGQYRNALWSTSVQAQGVWRVDAVRLLNAPL